MANGIFGNKAVVLSRVSTQGQVLQDGFSPQQNDLLAWAKEIGYSEFYQIDTAESGFLELDARDGWNRIFSFFEENPDYKTIIATEINRLAREESVLDEVKEYLYAHKIQLIIKDLDFYLLKTDGEKTLQADIMFNVYKSIARFEMDEKKSRKRRALKAYREKGYSIGGKRLFGYNREVGNLGTKLKYVENEAEKEEIKQIFEWYAYGIEDDPRPMSVLRITQECIARGMSPYLHSKRNVMKCLKERAYTGSKTTKNKKKNREFWNYKKEDAPKYVWAEQYECAYPAIIEQPLFDTVQQMLEKRNSRKNQRSNDMFVDKSSKHTTILSKLIVCPCCYKYLNGEYRIKDGQCKHSYRCASSRGVINKCNYKTSHSMVLLDSAVWAYLKTAVKQITQRKLAILARTDKEELKAAIKRMEEKLQGFEVMIDAESRVFRNNVSKNPSKENLDAATKEYDEKVNEIQRERDSYNREIAKKKQQLEELHHQEVSLRKANSIDISRIEQNKDEMYRYVHLLIDEINPVYSTRQFTVLEVVSNINIEAISIEKDTIKRTDKSSYVSYIFIDKRDTNRIKLKLIEGQVGWRNEIEMLQPVGNAVDDYIDWFALSAEDVFSMDWSNSDFIKTMSRKMGYIDDAFAVIDLPYSKLTVYNEDIR